MGMEISEIDGNICVELDVEGTFSNSKPEVAQDAYTDL